MAIKHIAIGGISTECSSYSPLYQNKADFEMIQGQALLDLVDYPFNEFNIKTHPLFFKKSVPGGPIEKQYFKEVMEEFIIEIMSIEMLEAIRKHKGNNGYNISVQISFLKAILQRSLHEYIYKKDEFESSKIHGLFEKIIRTLSSPEDPCPITNSNGEDANDQYNECLEWIDNACGKFFITKNEQDLFETFLELVSFGEVNNG